MAVLGDGGRLADAASLADLDEATAAEGASRMKRIEDHGPMKPVAISEFKARCLGLLEEVKATGEELVVTMRGAPIARFAPIAPAPPWRAA